MKVSFVFFVLIQFAGFNTQAQIEYGSYTSLKKCLGFEKSYNFGEKGIHLFLLESGEYYTSFVGYKEKEWMLGGNWKLSDSNKKIFFIPEKGFKRKLKIVDNTTITRRIFIVSKTIWNIEN